MDINEAIRIAKRECKDGYAQTYLKAIPNAIEFGAGVMENGSIHAFKVQILYALSNMRSWRGETAKQVKAVLKKFATTA
jgi:hypothetical protein